MAIAANARIDQHHPPLTRWHRDGCGRSVGPAARGGSQRGVLPESDLPLGAHPAPYSPSQDHLRLRQAQSTADEFTDSATVRRCKHFAARLGATLLRIVNLDAFRATDPRQLWKSADPIGPRNDTWLRAAADALATKCVVVAAWGAHASRADRVRDVTAMLTSTTTVHCLGTTQAGTPRHPLYLPNDSPLQIWPQPQPEAR